LVCSSVVPNACVLAIASAIAAGLALKLANN
jgi:hypothetical protein